MASPKEVETKMDFLHPKTISVHVNVHLSVRISSLFVKLTDVWLFFCWLMLINSGGHFESDLLETLNTDIR